MDSKNKKIECIFRSWVMMCENTSGLLSLSLKSLFLKSENSRLNSLNSIARFTPLISLLSSTGFTM